MAAFPTSAPSSPPLLRLEPFKGVNWSVTPTQIGQSQAEDMLNITLDERGAINKRTGYERVFATSLGPGAIRGMYEYRKSNGSVFFLLAHGTKLYTQSGNSQPVQIYSGLSGNDVHFFTMNDKCYLMDGTNYLVYDGSTVSAVVPYVPTLTISRPPAGGGEVFEDYNLLGAGFKDSFSSDGVATVYQLSLTGLDATGVKAEVNGATLTEGAGITVDRANGKVTFATSPAEGTNNVIITAYKYVGKENQIKKCRFSTMFGGSNDTRVFVSGNPDMPEYVWRLGLYDPSYAPENGFYKYPERVTAFSKQYDVLIIHRTNGSHVISFQLDENGNATFPSKPINDQVGTISGKSVQIIENNPCMLSKNGVYLLVSSNVRDERNMTPVSENVDARLLKESNLHNAFSIDFDRKYWLAVNGNVYILDYTQKTQESPYGEWYFYNNIPASCFLEKDGYLYFGSSTDGLIYRFKKETDARPYNDDGAPITAHWKSKYLTFGADERRKIVEKIFYNLKPDARTSADIYYVSDKKESDLVKSTRIDLFDFGDLDFSRLTFITSRFPRETMVKIKAKKITYFQLIIQNDKLDESLGIFSLGIKYRYQSEVK